MKKYIITLLLLIPVLTGCATVDTQITIDKNNSANVQVLAKSDDLSQTGSDIMHDFAASLEHEYTVIENSTENEFNIVGKKSVQNLSEKDLSLSSLGFITNLKSGKFIEVRKNWVLTSVNIDMSYNYKAQINKFKRMQMENLADNIDDFTMTPEYFQQDEDLVSSEKQVDQKFTEYKKDEQNIKNEKPRMPKLTVSIKVPAVAFYNNADFVNGDTYVWYMKESGKNDIKLQYVKYNVFILLFAFLAVVGALTAWALYLKKSDSQKRSDNINNIV